VAVYSGVTGKLLKDASQMIVDGATGNVTTPGSLTAGGLATTPLNASNLTSGTVADTRLSSNVPLKNAANTFTQDQRISLAVPHLVLNETTQPVDQRKFQLYVYQQKLGISSLNDAETLVPAAMQMDRAGNVSIFGDFSEKQRTTPLGHWVDLPQSQSSFTANTGTWSITGATIYTYAYTAIGKTLLVALVVNSTSVSGSPVELRLALPAGFTCASNIPTYPIINEAGVFATGSSVQGTAGAGYLSIYKAAAAAFTTTTNATNIYFCAPMRVP
jgi:hypothetical protein